MNAIHDENHSRGRLFKLCQWRTNFNSRTLFECHICTLSISRLFQECQTSRWPWCYSLPQGERLCSTFSLTCRFKCFMYLFALSIIIHVIYMTKHVQNLTKVGVICLSKCNVICKCNINMYINIIFHKDINKHGI